MSETTFIILNTKIKFIIFVPLLLVAITSCSKKSDQWKNSTCTIEQEQAIESAHNQCIGIVERNLLSNHKNLSSFKSKVSDYCDCAANNLAPRKADSNCKLRINWSDLKSTQLNSVCGIIPGENKF